MSKTKRALPEDIDITDPRDTFSPPEATEPSAVDYAMNDLQNASRTLLENAPQLSVGDIQDLTQIMEDLQSTVEAIRKPF